MPLAVLSETPKSLFLLLRILEKKEVFSRAQPRVSSREAVLLVQESRIYWKNFWKSLRWNSGRILGMRSGGISERNVEQISEQIS